MASSLLAMKKVSRKVHTPISFRAQRQLRFTPASLTSTPANSNQNDSQDNSAADFSTPADQQMAAQNTDVSHSKEQTSDDQLQAALSLQALNQQHSDNTTTPPLPALPLMQTRILPWEIAGNKVTSLYKSSPPDLVYPAGSRDEAVNERFITRMNMYLTQNFLVRSALSKATPHPFANYDRLKRYWAALGDSNRIFNTTETFATLDEIKVNGHMGFHSEMIELLWFGGCVSYGNIMAETYAIIYNWIKPDDLPDLEGLCEVHDGITFRDVVIKSLQTVRLQHTQELINHLYSKLDDIKLIMRPGGMTGYFAQVRSVKLRMKKQGEMVSESYLLRRIFLAVKGKHKKLDAVAAELRRKAGVSGVPIPIERVQDCLVDTFDFEIPSEDKKEKTSTVPANFATKRRAGDEHENGYPKKKKWKRRTFPKGSCANCPESTSHTTPYCYKTVRARKGLPSGWKWCTVHTEGIHYEHLCKRHAPNYPPPPKTTAARAEVEVSPDHLRQQLIAMIASTQPSQPAHSCGNGIVITKPKAREDFRQARDIPTNAATYGPPVDQIVKTIIGMSPDQRKQLQCQLADAGF